jgi:aminopeptidase-like protein
MTDERSLEQGLYAYNLAVELFPICRSITGNGVRQTLKILQRENPELEINEVPSGTQVFDWTIPKEWNIKDAWVKDKHGKKIIDFSETNLHVMGYSTPVHKTIPLKELLEIIYTEPDQPEAIPYVTSYYKERYGFCITDNQKKQITRDYSENDLFEICIDSTLEAGSLTYGELVLEPCGGNERVEEKKEILFSTYICHPSLANNELSGPCVSMALVKWLKSCSVRKYRYRFLFIPETIGSITYLSKHYKELQKSVIAGFNLTCVGDDRTYSYMPTAYGDTISDKVLKNVLNFHYPEYKTYSFLQSGSDERRYNAPGVDLPIACFCRSLYGMYPEYHTSADNLSLISPEGLQGSFDVMKKCIIALENNQKYKMTCLCEPQLGKRGLYPSISRKGQYDEIYKLVNMISYFDGKNDLIDVSNIIKVPVEEMLDNIEKLASNKLIETRL